MRWLKFNAVGAMGMVVHLGMLAVLHHVFNVHYMVATALSVELAIFHNFVWHRRWTWADRFGESPADSAGAAFLRFNLTNGLVSLISNLFSAYVLTGFWNLDPVLSNILSFGPSCIINYLLSDRIVFCRSAALTPSSVSDDGQCCASESIGKSAGTPALL